ncbi:MAG: hypothetical protein NC394_03340 [Bacteroides sp.]|nr:hypothetical protein [Bacteroides sp.]
MRFKDSRGKSRKNEIDPEERLESIKNEIKRNDLSEGEKRAKKLTDIISLTVSLLLFLSTAITLVFVRRPYPENIYENLGVEPPLYAQTLSEPTEKLFNSDKSVPDQLSELVLADGVRVYKSDSTSFVMSEDKADKEELSELSKRLEGAVETDVAAEEGETVYYLILLDNGKKVNFSLSVTSLEVYGKKYAIRNADVSAAARAKGLPYLFENLRRRAQRMCLPRNSRRKYLFFYNFTCGGGFSAETPESLKEDGWEYVGALPFQRTFY